VLEQKQESIYQVGQDNSKFASPLLHKLYK